MMVEEIEKQELERLRRYTNDAKWLMQNYEQYRPTYGGSYVAVYQEQIIEHDENLLELKRRVRDRPAFIQYVYREKPELIL